MNERCACGHPRSAHTTYAMGTNAKGSRYVCTKDNCAWTVCDLTDDAATLDQPPREGT